MRDPVSKEQGGLWLRTTPKNTGLHTQRERERQTWTHTSTPSHKHIGTYKLAHTQIKVFIITRNTYYKI